MKSLFCKIREGQWEKLREMAYLERTSMGALVREALDELFKLREGSK